MQAIILAAGMGKRLGEYTQDNTKCMLEVNGIKLIDRALATLHDINVSRDIADADGPHAHRNDFASEIVDGHSITHLEILIKYKGYAGKYVRDKRLRSKTQDDSGYPCTYKDGSGIHTDLHKRVHDAREPDQEDEDAADHTKNSRGPVLLEFNAKQQFHKKRDHKRRRKDYKQPYKAMQ